MSCQLKSFPQESNQAVFTRAHRAFGVDEDPIDVSSAFAGKETSSQLVLNALRNAPLRDEVVDVFPVKLVFSIPETENERSR